ncbi:hypothetical protein [Actinomadura sp. 6N118]|uniref:hypothetical protein n=1 Tax=Actinomadura sp. 6N118 TaxID=3375151 RepID=UPI00379F56DB
MLLQPAHQVVTGARPGRRDAAEIVVFDSTGTAVQDVAAAEAVHRAAVREGTGLPLPLRD